MRSSRGLLTLGRVPRALLFFAIGFAGVAALFACSSSSSPGLVNNDPTGNGDQDASRPDGSSSKDASQDTGAQTSDASGLDAGAELGSIPVEGVEGGTCIPFSGNVTEVVPGSLDAGASDASTEGVGGYFRLGKVGSRRFVANTGEGRMLTFDSTGNEASYEQDLGGNLSAVDSQGSTIGSVVATNDAVLYRQYTADGTLSSIVDLAPTTAGALAVAFTGGASTSLGLWAAGGVLNANSIANSNGALGTAFTFGKGTYNARIELASATNGDTFAVAWTSDALNSSSTAIQFALLTPQGLSGSIKSFGSGYAAVQATRLIATSNGYALLATSTHPDTYVIVLDATGAVVGSAYRFDDSLGWDLAASGDEIGLVASTVTRDPTSGAVSLSPVFRPLDSTGQPLSSWVCLSAGASSISYASSVAVDSEGSQDYALTLSDGDGGEELVRFNNLGTAPAP